jgi:hypothetical protein
LLLLLCGVWAYCFTASSLTVTELMDANFLDEDD